MSTCKISKEDGQFAVSSAKTGLILAWFDRRDQAEDYRADQLRAAEQQAVMSAYNDADEARALLAEFLACEL